MAIKGFSKEQCVKTSEDAIKIFNSQNYNTVFFYNSKNDILNQEISKFYKYLKLHNSELTQNGLHDNNIENIDNQILPTNPYYWDGIDGCLAVKCAEISWDTFEKNKNLYALFTGFNYNVLSHSKDAILYDYL